MKLLEEGERLAEGLPQIRHHQLLDSKITLWIDFPKDKGNVIEHAVKNKTKLEQPEQVIDTLKEMADRTYHNMVEVEKALGNIRKEKKR